MDENTEITVVMVKPGKKARLAAIGTSLEDLQRAVDGCIETFYPFEDPDVCIVLNDEGKINGMQPNRAIYDGNGNVTDIVFGPFFICDCSGYEFGSLSEEKAEKYLEQFKLPEMFFRTQDGVKAIPYEPKKELER